MQVNCLDPEVIYNPLLSELVSIHSKLVVNGHIVDFINPKKIYYDFRPQNYLPSPADITLDNLNSYYVVDSVTGEHYPAYIQVPCGHCEVCKNAKVNAFVDRCKLETQMYKCNPLFITLTYDELHKKEQGVCLRDVQLFFKRLRVNLYRQGYREKIRYALVSEYGRRTRRPHYHAILWNLHATSVFSYFDLRATIEKSWSNGFVQCRLIDPSNDKAFYYTAKYLRKDCDVPEGCNTTFMVCSNRGGSIGAAFIDSVRRSAVKHFNTSIKYVNKWNGRIYDVRLSRYLLNRLVPSISRALPYSLKCRVRRFLTDYSILDYRNNANSFLFDDEFMYFHKFFSKYFYLPEPCYVRDLRPDDTILREMLEDELFIQRCLVKGEKYFDDAVFYSNRRDRYIMKLFADATEQDLPAKAYRIRHQLARSAALEIF